MIFPLTEALLEAARKATPGPWKSNREGFAALSEDHTVAMRAGPHSLMVGSVMEAFSNVEFAVAARNAIPEIEKLLAQVTWQPVETAPHEAGWILVYDNRWHLRQVVRWMGEGEHGPGWCTPDGHEVFGITHWMPLPASPSHQEGETC